MTKQKSTKSFQLEGKCDGHGFNSKGIALKDF
jgi:hypothetical protein